MNCRDFEELLSAYADGELPRTQRDFIEEHLSGCSDCRETLARFEAAGRRLASLKKTPAVPDMREATLREIKAAGARPPQGRRWLRPVAAAAAILVIIAIPVLVKLWSADSPSGGIGAMSPPPLSEYIKGYTYTLALLAGVLMMAGLAFRNRLARKTAGFMSVVFGGIGIYLGLDALLSIIESDQSLIMGVIPLFGLITGTVYIKKQTDHRWLAAVGLLSCLAALILYDVFLINFHHRFSWLFLAAAIVIPAGIIGYFFHHKITAFLHCWWRPSLATSAIAVVVAVLLIAQPWGMESPEAAAASIVSSSPEVRTALGGEEIEDVEVTTKIVDEDNNVLMVLVRTEARAVAAAVNLETKQVTEIVRVEVPDFQTGDEQRAIDIVGATPEVQELLVQGGAISEVHLAYSIEGETVIPTALLTIEQGRYDWNISVDLQEGEVASIGRSQPSGAMTVVHISRFLTRFVAPVLLLLGILLAAGLSLGYRRAGTLAGTAALVLGITGLFMAIYSLSSIWWRQVLSVGIPAVGLVIGIADLRQRGRRRWLPVTGIILGALALALVFLNELMLNVNNVPGESIFTLIVMTVIIAGIIAYALKKKIMNISVSGRWLRPAAVALAAVVILIVVLAQPWSANPEGVIAKAYAATEGLLSYRATISSDDGASDSVIEFASPDRIHARLTSGEETDEFIIIGGSHYVKSGNMPRNVIITFSDSVSSMLYKERTLNLIGALTDVETLPDEPIKGVDSFHYRGSYDMSQQVVDLKLSMKAARERAGSEHPTDEEINDMVKDMLETSITVELWIGKEDSLIRQLAQTVQHPEDGELQTSSMTMTFYDFNEPISIKPPLDADGELLEDWQLAGGIGSNEQVFSRNIVSSTGSREGYDDWEHQEVTYAITITNNSSETVSNVKLTINTMLLEREGRSLVAAEPETPTDVIAPGESRTFHARIPFAATGLTKEEIIELHDKATILVHFTTEDDRELTESLYPDAPYPTAKPPTTTPPPEE